MSGLSIQFLKRYRFNFQSGIVSQITNIGLFSLQFLKRLIRVWWNRSLQFLKTVYIYQGKGVQSRVPGQGNRAGDNPVEILAGFAFETICPGPRSLFGFRDTGGVWLSRYMDI